MVRGLSLSTLASTGNGGFCGSVSSWRRDFKLPHKSHVGIDRECVFHHFVRSLNSKGKPGRCLRVEAGWLFKGVGDKGGFDATSERSDAANEDILIFFFQLDLATRVQVTELVCQFLFLCV